MKKSFLTLTFPVKTGKTILIKFYNESLEREKFIIAKFYKDKKLVNIPFFENEYVIEMNKKELEDELSSLPKITLKNSIKFILENQMKNAYGGPFINTKDVVEFYNLLVYDRLEK